MTNLPHNHLPPPLDRYASMILLEHAEHADFYLLMNLGLLIIIAVVQWKVFHRPPPVPLKRLPRRPALSIMFKPDDITSASHGDETCSQSVSSSALNRHEFKRTTSSFLKASFEYASDENSDVMMKDVDPVSTSSSSPPSPPRRSAFSGSASVGTDDGIKSTSAESLPKHSFDLPDSFAPLLSSSQTEVLLHQLTADLIHGIRAEASVKMQPGPHEIPLNKDLSRPQLILDAPSEGCQISVGASIGSDGFSSAQDLDVTIETSSRSRPMVKHAGLIFEPSLPLKNVAPTLIHFPTLFEDNTVVPRLRRIQIIRFFVDTITAISATIEQVLWVIERFLQIHLGKVRIVPLYKGKKVGNDAPEWRLSLAFSGHVLLFGFIPIPFINVILPTFIIPQPHALLEFLLSKQPLASARIKRENIAEQKIAVALVDTVHSWQAKLDVVATPPAVGIDLKMPGGVALGLEIMHGRDASAGRSRQDAGDSINLSSPANQHGHNIVPEVNARAAPSSGASMSSWTTNNESASDFHQSRASYLAGTASKQIFDANNLVPWKLQFSAKGSMEKEKMSFHLLNCSFEHDDASSQIPARSQIRLRGSFACWKAGLHKKFESVSFGRTSSFAHRAALAGATETPSVAAVLMFPDETESFHSESRMLEYDYAFDVSEESKVDAITFSVGANHPFLNGGSMVTTILDSIYAFGSVTARHNAVLDPIERHRKRNVLRHLPAIDFTFGIMNSHIPAESLSYTDDGLTRTLPEMDGGRIKVRILGGIVSEGTEEDNFNSSATADLISVGLSVDGNDVDVAEAPVADGIKVVADFGFSSIVLNSESRVNEFPELDVFEGTKLRTLTSGKLGGCVKCHLRPQHLAKSVSTTGPNIFNPLEAYEIDFSGSSLSVRIKESSTSLGHRRIIIPTETTIKVKVLESIVDMALEGKSDCELSWDFQGLSPILQVTDVGLSPELVVHEKKQQVSLLITPLRQGRLNFHVSPVGGINITKAATSREDKEGLYDWKFFNAIVSPDETSASRLFDVIHDKRTMGKLLQVIKLINADCHKVFNYVLTQVWRAKEILDQEGVSDPKHIIPGHRMARLLSLLLCDNDSLVPVVLPVVRRVVAGNGLDVPTVKELLRKHCEFYDDWTPEIDRAVRWLETMFAPTPVSAPYVENNVTPLSELECYSSRFKGIPSAAELYENIRYRPHLPLDKKFSNMVGRVAPYLSFKQIEYFLKLRSTKDWQASDLKRLRYVYSVKRKVMDIAESYGGLSFLPQSFLVSVFLGEATRDSLRVVSNTVDHSKSQRFGGPNGLRVSNKPSILLSLRQRRAPLQDPSLGTLLEESEVNVNLTPAGRVASMSNFAVAEPSYPMTKIPERSPQDEKGQYELGDCLLGPADVAILLQAGLTSAMKGSSVVQLNQRMLLDLVASQPKSFAIAVLAELGTPSGQGSPRQLASALMALLELDQNSFRPVHRLNMHTLLETWLPGLRVPRREDHMAGGRWARQSYYDALFSLAKSILEDAEGYMALKFHLQRVRHHTESDPVPLAQEELQDDYDHDELSSRVREASSLARSCIERADARGNEILVDLLKHGDASRLTSKYQAAVDSYRDAFDACSRTRSIDKLSFHMKWFQSFYQRNYDALMIKSIYDNVVNDIDKVRYWMHCLRRGAKFGAPRRNDQKLVAKADAGGDVAHFVGQLLAPLHQQQEKERGNAPTDQIPQTSDDIFLDPTKHSEQELVDAIIDAIIYYDKDRARLKKDPLVRLLIPNPPGNYDFTIVTAMGVITDGKAGTELQSAIERMENSRGVKTIRADTATARSLEYNASKIIEAIMSARELNVPYGLLGYSQGCANALMAETILNSGTPRQQQEVADKNGLVCRQLLFSAANASIHGPASDKKVQNLIVMVEDFFKYQQGYFSRALQSAFLDVLTSALDSAQFHKLMGGADSFLADGCRSFWRESQHLAQVPTCTIRGVLEEHTTPEALEMLTNMLTKQSGSALHDSQVHVYDAVGHPVYHHNRNGKILEKCDVGKAAIQRTHHWSPLNEEVDFISTKRDAEMASFECAKDRHIFPWVDVNARFGFIKYSKSEEAKDGIDDGPISEGSNESLAM